MGRGERCGRRTFFLTKAFQFALMHRATLSFSPVELQLLQIWPQGLIEPIHRLNSLILKLRPSTHGDIDTISDKIGVGEWRIRPALVVKRAGDLRPQSAWHIR